MLPEGISMSFTKVVNFKLVSGNYQKAGSARVSGSCQLASKAGLERRERRDRMTRRR